MQKEIQVPLRGGVLFRAMLSCAIDADEPFYTIVSYSSVSFLFLGGLQINYQATFSVMLGIFALMSTGDSLRILTAFYDSNSLKDFVPTSTQVSYQMRNVTTQLSPGNVYEDFGRGKMVVVMVFVTQCILISFVVVDIYQNETHTCIDGTPDCPVVNTLGSWGYYILGTFMACVFLLGPKSGFGESQQNPAFWLQLLLSAKQAGCSISWYDPVQDVTHTRELTQGDWRIWARFIMSFLVNGVGFHILVHALPIQVASQSSLTGIVFRAVGMIYLVDLDNTSGYKLTIQQNEKEGEATKQGAELKPDSTTQSLQPIVEDNVSVFSLGTHKGLDVQVQAIIDEAHAKIDALVRGNRGPVASTRSQAHRNNGMSIRSKLILGGHSSRNAILAAGAGTSGRSMGIMEIGVEEPSVRSALSSEVGVPSARSVGTIVTGPLSNIEEENRDVINGDGGNHGLSIDGATEETKYDAGVNASLGKSGTEP